MRILVTLALLLLAPSAHGAEPDFGPLQRSIEAGERGPIVALVVEQHGEVVYEHRFRAGSARKKRKGRDPSLHDIRSAGKSITALAVGAAIADGKLASVHALVWPLLGRPDDATHGGIRVQDLLTMSSALECDDGQARSPGNEERMYRRASWRSFALQIPVDAAVVRDEQGLGRFSYCTAGVFLLGQVLEAVTGEAFDEYVQRRLFAPLGIEQVVWNRSRSGEVQSGGQIEIAAGDLGKLGRLVLDRGSWEGEELIPSAWITQILTPWRRLGPMMAYGYLWWFRPLLSEHGWVPSWSMSGNGGNIVALCPEADAVITVQSAAYNRPGAHDRSYALIAEALAQLESVQGRAAPGP